jgi:hypothetical protein
MRLFGHQLVVFRTHWWTGPGFDRGFFMRAQGAKFTTVLRAVIDVEANVEVISQSLYRFGEDLQTISETVEQKVHGPLRKRRQDQCTATAQKILIDRVAALYDCRPIRQERLADHGIKLLE